MKNNMPKKKIKNYKKKLTYKSSKKKKQRITY